MEVGADGQHGPSVMPRAEVAGGIEPIPVRIPGRELQETTARGKK